MSIICLPWRDFTLRRLNRETTIIVAIVINCIFICIEIIGFLLSLTKSVVWPPIRWCIGEACRSYWRLIKFACINLKPTKSCCERCICIIDLVKSSPCSPIIPIPNTTIDRHGLRCWICQTWDWRSPIDPYGNCVNIPSVHRQCTETITTLDSLICVFKVFISILNIMLLKSNKTWNIYCNGQCWASITLAKFHRALIKILEDQIGKACIIASTQPSLKPHISSIFHQVYI